MGGVALRPRLFSAWTGMRPLQGAHAFRLKRFSIMKNRFRMLAWAVVIVLLAVSTAAGSEGVFSPVWRVGDFWQVRVVYPSPSPAADGEWSAPVYWNYRVSGREMEGTEERYIVDVSEQVGRVGLKARLFYRCADGSLAGVDMEKMSRGKIIGTTLVYEKGVPAVSERTLTPCDTPVFPLHLPSSTDYVVTRRIDQELKIRETVRQEVRRVRGIEGLPDRLEDRDLIEVRCLSEDGTLIFVQYWDENSPWPVYGRNRNMRYWLVEE